MQVVHVVQVVLNRVTQMWATNFYKSFFKNMFLYMNGRLSQIRSVHTYGLSWIKVDSCFCEAVYVLILNVLHKYKTWKEASQNLICCYQTWFNFASVFRCLSLHDPDRQNWDREPDLKRHLRSDRDWSSAIGDLLSDLLKLSCKNSIEKLNGKTWQKAF